MILKGVNQKKVLSQQGDRANKIGMLSQFPQSSQNNRMEKVTTQIGSSNINKEDNFQNILQQNVNTLQQIKNQRRNTMIDNSNQNITNKQIKQNIKPYLFDSNSIKQTPKTTQNWNLFLSTNYMKQTENQRYNPILKIKSNHYQIFNSKDEFKIQQKKDLCKSFDIQQNKNNTFLNQHSFLTNKQERNVFQKIQRENENIKNEKQKCEDFKNEQLVRMQELISNRQSIFIQNKQKRQKQKQYSSVGFINNNLNQNIYDKYEPIQKEKNNKLNESQISRFDDNNENSISNDFFSVRNKSPNIFNSQQSIQKYQTNIFEENEKQLIFQKRKEEFNYEIAKMIKKFQNRKIQKKDNLIDQINKDHHHSQNIKIKQQDNSGINNTAVQNNRKSSVPINLQNIKVQDNQHSSKTCIQKLKMELSSQITNRLNIQNNDINCKISISDKNKTQKMEKKKQSIFEIFGIKERKKNRGYNIEKKNHVILAAQNISNRNLQQNRLSKLQQLNQLSFDEILNANQSIRNASNNSNLSSQIQKQHSHINLQSNSQNSDSKLENQQSLIDLNSNSQILRQNDRNRSLLNLPKNVIDNLNKRQTNNSENYKKNIWQKIGTKKLKSIYKLDSQYPLPIGQQDNKVETEVVALLNIIRYKNVFIQDVPKSKNVFLDDYIQSITTNDNSNQLIKVLSNSLIHNIEDEKLKLMENLYMESNKLIHYKKEQTEDILSIERQNPNCFYNYFKYKVRSKESLGQYLKNRVEFYNICKNSTIPQIQDELARDPYFHFFLQCQQDMDLAIPILQNCTNKSLTLQNQILSQAQCKALQVSSQYFQGFVNQIYFDNCMISDKYFSKLLESLGLQKDFKSLVYKQNEFEIGSASQISALLKKQFPYNLQELKIENCKINYTATEILTQHLNDFSSLSKLALVNVSLNQKSIKILSQFILNNNKIEFLDLSWNRAQPEFWGQLFIALKSNQVIQDFIFQQNQLVPKEIQSRENIIKNLENHKKIERKFKRKILRLKRKQKYGENEEQIAEQEYELKKALMNPDEVLICDCLCDFIVYNPNICHINLQGCGLNYFIIKNIVDSVRKSHSLVGLHLSHNSGIDFEMKQYIIDKLHCKKNEFDEIQTTDLKKFEVFRKYQHNMENEVEVSMKLKEIIQKEREELQQPLTTFNNDDNICSITRYNGHRFDLRDRPGQWQINAKTNQECYICQKWIYSLVFLNPIRLQHLQTKIKSYNQCKIITQFQRKKMTEEEKFQEQIQKYLSQFIQQNNQINSDQSKTESENREYLYKFDVKQENKESFENSNRIYTQDQFMLELKQNPNINNQFKVNFTDFGIKKEEICLHASFTNWHQKGMINFLQFIENIDQKRPNIFENLKNQNLLRNKINDIQSMKLEEVESFMSAVNKYREHIKQNWQLILARNTKYLKPSILNLILDDLQYPENLYVFPTFIKHGKHHALINIKNNVDQSYDWLFLSELVDLRQEDIFVYNKSIEKSLQSTKFIKDDSVFSKWRQENDEFALECLDHDFSLWNFRVSNYINFQDIDEIKQVILKHFIQIKEIFVNLQCISNIYPIVNPDDLKQFLQKCDNDKNKHLNTQIIEKLFSDSISDEDEQENQQDAEITQQKLKFMPRWSFLELIVRVAIDKYQEFKKKYRPVQMVEQYLKVHLLAYKISEQWQQMRDDYIWKNEVQNVFKDKIKMLHKLYFKYAINQPKRQMSINCCINLFIENCKLNINNEEVKFCFAMSKMTIISDNQPSLFETVEFVEFIEIICRVADFQFRKTDNQTFQLHKKINFIIDLLEQMVESDDILNQDSQELVVEKVNQQVYSDDEY